MRAKYFKLLFLGSDTFSVKVLQPLLEYDIGQVEVVTKPRTPLSTFCKANKLVEHRWKPGLTHLDDASFNIGLVASFGELIDPDAVRRFKYGLFNIHPSLLPQYRGSTPIQAAVFDGLRETGCTVMKIPPIAKFDIGDIVSQQKLTIRQREYAFELGHRLAGLGASMTIDFLLNYEERIKLMKQQGTDGRSLAKKLKPEQGFLRFKSESSDVIDRRVLAYTNYIELYTKCLGGLHIKLRSLQSPKETEILNIDSLMHRYGGPLATEPGAMFFHKHRGLLCIKSADCKWLAFGHATPLGKPVMTASDFNNGYLYKHAITCRETDV